MGSKPRPAGGDTARTAHRAPRGDTARDIQPRPDTRQGIQRRPRSAGPPTPRRTGPAADTSWASSHLRYAGTSCRSTRSHRVGRRSQGPHCRAEFLDHLGSCRRELDPGRRIPFGAPAIAARHRPAPLFAEVSQPHGFVGRRGIGQRLPPPAQRPTAEAWWRVPAGADVTVVSHSVNAAIPCRRRWR